MTNTIDIEAFEKQLMDLAADFQLLEISSNRLREAVRAEASRAEAAEAAQDEAKRTNAELRATAAAATAGANQATQDLIAVQEELTNARIKLELAERQRSLFEEKCIEMSKQIAVLEKDAQEYKPLQSSFVMLQKQYVELLERVQASTDDAKREANRLENELRRVEKCAGAGSELRERARLAAAAHVRERRFTAAELHDTTRELQVANGEVIRLTVQVAELKRQLSDVQEKNSTDPFALDKDILSETKAALEEERNNTRQLERALASALADNATLAALLHRADNATEPPPETTNTKEPTSTNISTIDSFLAE